MTLNPFKYLRFLRDAANKIDEQNEETKKIIKNARAMLNGEDGWFLGEAQEQGDEDIKLTCVCKRVENHAD